MAPLRALRLRHASRRTLRHAHPPLRSHRLGRLGGRAWGVRRPPRLQCRAHAPLPPATRRDVRHRHLPPLRRPIPPLPPVRCGAVPCHRRRRRWRRRRHRAARRERRRPPWSNEHLRQALPRRTLLCSCLHPPRLPLRTRTPRRPRAPPRRRRRGGHARPLRQRHLSHRRRRHRRRRHLRPPHIKPRTRRRSDRRVGPLGCARCVDAQVCPHHLHTSVETRGMPFSSYRP